MTALGRCSASLLPLTGLRSDRCKRQGRVTHEGRVYCRQHDPVALAQREAARADAAEQHLAATDANHAAGDALVARLGCGIVSSAMRRTILITFEDAERLIAERDAKAEQQ